MKKNKRDLREDFYEKYQEVEQRILEWIAEVEKNLIALRNKMHGS